MPAVLSAVAEAGAQGEGYTLLRLPLTVKPVFLEWLKHTHHDSRQRIENAIRSVHGGELNSSEFGKRLAGSGLMADQIKQVFRTFAKKHGLDGKLPEFDYGQFQGTVSRSRADCDFSELLRSYSLPERLGR